MLYVPYRSLLSDGGVSRLAETYFPSGSALAAQDWFTALSWERPEVVFNVPCQYNFMSGGAG